MSHHDKDCTEDIRGAVSIVRLRKLTIVACVASAIIMATVNFVQRDGALAGSFLLLILGCIALIAYPAGLLIRTKCPYCKKLALVPHTRKARNDWDWHYVFTGTKCQQCGASLVSGTMK